MRNQNVTEYMRTSIKDGLSQLPEGWVDRFKLMYGRNGGARSVDDAKAMSIDDILHEMPEDKLEHALNQVENSIRKLEKVENEQRKRSAK